MSPKLLKTLPVFLLLQTILSFSLFAAERIEKNDEDGDGFKETQVIYEGDKILRVTADKNKDKKDDVEILFKNGKRSTGTADLDFDGKIDQWTAYDAEGATKKIAKDTNQDGKPDYFQEMLQGRNLVLKEWDRNFDGKVDKRSMMQWDANKSIPLFQNNRMSRLPNPGYVALSTELDDNYDGKIDSYREKGNENASQEKIGKPI